MGGGRPGGFARGFVCGDCVGCRVTLGAGGGGGGALRCVEVFCKQIENIINSSNSCLE